VFIWAILFTGVGIEMQDKNRLLVSTQMLHDQFSSWRGLSARTVRFQCCGIYWKISVSYGFRFVRFYCFRCLLGCVVYAVKFQLYNTLKCQYCRVLALYIFSIIHCRFNSCNIYSLKCQYRRVLAQ